MPALHDVPAPAKLNLFLHVLGRRADGRHLLQTVFRFVSLGDVLHFERTVDGRVVREGDVAAGLPADPQADLAVRAACCLRQATGTSYGARIRIEKRVPVGGGLGGGSSDAATTLMALNRLWGTGLRRPALLQLALTLGADVPAFVYGRSAFAQGVGERLEAVLLPPRAYWIVHPGVSVSTQAVFADPNLTRNSASVKIADFAEWQSGGSGLFGRNDLQATVFARYPAVARVAGAVRAAGLDLRMTGSGSCLFAEFPNPGLARVHADRIISKMDSLPAGLIGGSWVCRGLVDHPLRGWLAD